jgi:hypothetical protein
MVRWPNLQVLVHFSYFALPYLILAMYFCVPRVAPYDNTITDGITSVPLAFSIMTPNQVCKAFSRGLGRQVQYRRGPIMINVPTPAGYREHLSALAYTLGEKGTAYFGPELEKDCPRVALELWEGNRDIEEYAREVFPVEEAANGLTWMEEVETPETPRRDFDNGVPINC